MSSTLTDLSCKAARWLRRSTPQDETGSHTLEVGAPWLETLAIALRVASSAHEAALVASRIFAGGHANLARAATPHGAVRRARLRRQAATLALSAFATEGAASQAGVIADAAVAFGRGVAVAVFRASTAARCEA